MILPNLSGLSLDRKIESQVELIPATHGPGDGDGDDATKKYRYSPFVHCDTGKAWLGSEENYEQEEEEEEQEVVTGFEELDNANGNFIVNIKHKNDTGKTKITLRMQFANVQDVLETVEDRNIPYIFPRAGCSCRSRQAGFDWIAEINLVDGTDPQKKVLKYKFSSGATGGSWETTPYKAFRSTYTKLTKGEVAPSYINARMMVGIFYPEVQAIIKNLFTFNTTGS
jgi:hypothetical protein